MMPLMARAVHRLRGEPVVLVALVTAVVLTLAAIAVPLMPGIDPHHADLTRRLQAPGWAGGEGGLLGTDELGRSLAVRIAYGLRTSLMISFFAVLLGAIIGTTAGLLAGYRGGRTDAVVMRAADVQLAFPALLLTMTVIAAFGKSTIVIVVILGLSSWDIFARLIRASVVTIRSGELVMASVGLGATARRIIGIHVLPNLLAPLTAVGTLELARIVLAEASLSFLGFGVSPPSISLGAILASGRTYLQNQWWVATFAGLFLALAVLSANLVGNWLQRVTDPTVRVKA